MPLLENAFDKEPQDRIPPTAVLDGWKEEANPEDPSWDPWAKCWTLWHGRLRPQVPLIHLAPGFPSNDKNVFCLGMNHHPRISRLPVFSSRTNSRLGFASPFCMSTGRPDRPRKAPHRVPGMAQRQGVELEVKTVLCWLWVWSWLFYLQGTAFLFSCFVLCPDNHDSLVERWWVKDV